MHDFIGTSELARRLNVSISTLYRWLSEGRLPPPTQLRRNFFVWRLAEVQDLLDAASDGPCHAPPVASAC